MRDRMRDVSKRISETDRREAEKRIAEAQGSHSPSVGDEVANRQVLPHSHTPTPSSKSTRLPDTAEAASASAAQPAERPAQPTGQPSRKSARPSVQQGSQFAPRSSEQPAMHSASPSLPAVAVQAPAQPTLRTAAQTVERSAVVQPAQQQGMPAMRQIFHPA